MNDFDEQLKTFSFGVAEFPFFSGPKTKNIFFSIDQNDEHAVLVIIAQGPSQIFCTE